MKGIILAGGHGSRLDPMTRGCSKQLLSIYNKPMIYYPLSVLMLAGIRDILIITTPEDQSSFERLFGNGAQLGLSLQFIAQKYPEGLAQAFVLGESFIDDEPVCLILGDNVFYGPGFRPKLLQAATLDSGALIFGYQVKDPERFGVVEFDNDGHVLSVEEKPSIPKSQFAITGLYFYDSEVCEIAKSISKSARGEFEITSINEVYLRRRKLRAERLGRGFAWLDTGTPKSLLEASQFVHTIETRQGFKIACPEEIAFVQGWITGEQLLETANQIGNTDYRAYLESIIHRAKP